MSVLAPDALVSWPGLIFEVAWAADPFDPAAVPAWTDLSDRLELFSVKTAGRNYELARTEAGEFTGVLRNKDGYLDPANTSSPYSPYVLPYRMFRLRGSWDSVDYDIAAGYVERWPQSWRHRGNYGLIEAVGTDALGLLALVELQGAVAGELLADDPIAYFPMDDPAGTTGPRNLATTAQPTPWIVDSKEGAGTVTFGATGIPPGDPTSAVEFGDANAAADPAVGALLQLSSETTPGPHLAGAGGFSVELWFRTTDAAVVADRYLYRQNSPTGAAEIVIELLSTHQLRFSVSGATSIDSAGAVNDDQPHHVVLKLHTDAQTVTAYLDGTAIGSTVAGAPVALTGKTVTVGGNVRNQIGRTYLSGTINATVQHVAIYDAPLASLSITEHYQAGLLGAGHGEAAGARVSRLLGYAGYAGASTVATGNSTLQGAAELAGRSTLEALLDVEQAEQGRISVAGDGSVVFTNRHARYNQTVSATFGESGGEWPYQGDISFDFDPATIYNLVEVERPGGATGTARDTTSARQYGRRRLSLSMRVDSDGQVQDAADYLLARHKDPRQRVASVTIEPSSRPELWPTALGLEPGARVQVKRRPTSAPVSTLDCIVERKTHSVAPGVWRTTFELSPADVETYWQLEDLVYGEIDNPDIRIAY